MRRQSDIDINEDVAWDYLLENGIATEEEMKLVIDIVGYDIEAFESILYARTGYRSFDQVMEEDEEDEAW